MAGDLDKDELDLCRALCTRAGMLFEDASAGAILVRHLKGEGLRKTIRNGRDMAERAEALLAAAEALIGREVRRE
jgi:hypothetical protein